MSDQYPLLNGMPIDRLKMKELRQEPKQRGLKAYGLKKAKMIERLKGDICKEKQVGHRDEVHNENAEKSVPDNAEHVASVSEDTAKKSDNLVSIENSPTENELVVAQPEPGKNDVSENDKMASGFSSDSRVPAECSIHSTGEQSPENLDVEGSFTADCDHDDTSGDAKASPSHATGVEGAVSDIAGNFTSGREAVAPEVPKRKRKLKDSEYAWKSSKKTRRWLHSHVNRVPATQPPKLRSIVTRDAPKLRSIVTRDAPMHRSIVTRDAPMLRSIVTRDAPELRSIVTWDAFQPVAAPPSSKRATNSLRIDCFVRPFTLQQVKDLLGKTGSIAKFWMNEIKTHCYVTFSSVEEAVATRNAVHYLKWPEKGESNLEADFVNPIEVTIRCENAAQAPAVTHASPSLYQKRRPSVKDRLNPPLPPTISEKKKSQKGMRKVVPVEEVARTQTKAPAIALDKRLKMTVTKPSIYYLALSEEQVQEKLS